MLGIFVRIQGFGAQIWSEIDEPSGAAVKAEGSLWPHHLFSLLPLMQMQLLAAGVDGFHVALVKKSFFAHMKPCKTSTFWLFFQENLVTVKDV